MSKKISPKILPMADARHESAILSSVDWLHVCRVAFAFSAEELEAYHASD